MQLTDPQLRTISLIFIETAQVSLAALVVPYIFGSVDLVFGMIGLIGTPVFWILGITFSR